MAIRSCVTDVLLRLAASDRETGGNPKLRSEDRELVVGLLERLLIDPDGVLFHEAQLLQVFEETRHGEPLKVEEHQAVLVGNWERLDEFALAKLLLNPAEMRAINREILDTLPEYWGAVMDRECESGFDELKAMEDLDSTPTA